MRKGSASVGTVPAEILTAVRSDDDAAFDALVSNEDCCFIVDWSEEDERIVQDCESVLRTGQLAAEWVDSDLFVIFGTKRVRVPLTESPADRHITLLALNEALSPVFEVRMLYASVGSDSATFVPLSSGGWSALEKEAYEVMPRRFHRLATQPNTFTEVVKIPTKARARPWWRFWSGG
jgi:hypothetical protein